MSSFVSVATSSRLKNIFFRDKNENILNSIRIQFKKKCLENHAISQIKINKDPYIFLDWEERINNKDVVILMTN